MRRLPYLLLVTLFLLVACGGSDKPPPQGEVIIPETTKVADAATRGALQAYDPDSGVMRFSAATPVLQSLSVGDVLAGEPSAAAPAGYLRKVEAVRQENGQVSLETSQANLTDAIHQGELTEEGNFTAADVLSVTAHLEGVTAEALTVPAELATAAGVGDNYGFRVGFDEVALNLGEGDVKVRVRLNGELHFNAGWGVHLNIRRCLEIPPVCVRSFEAKVGMEEHLKVSVSGEANARLTKEFKVASYYFKPLVFFIGPVPVVVVPSVEVFVGATGEVRLSFSYGVTQTARAVVGARWTSGDGWKNITGFGVNLVGHDQFDFYATMNARAYARALASLKFYGVAGPALGLLVAAELDAAIPRNPAWIARAGLEGNVAFVVGLPVVGTLKEYRATLFKESIELARSANQAPRFSNVTPGTIRVDLRRPVYLGAHSGFVRGQFDVMDPEGDPITLSARSDRDGTITLPQQAYSFTTPGVRTLTITARDSRGASSSTTVRFDAVNSPPSLTVGATGTPYQGEAFTMTALVSDINESDPGRLCAQTTWLVVAPDMVSPPTGCQVNVTFGTTGSRTVQVTTRDTEGATASASRTLNVLPPPENPYPRITNKGMYSRDSVFIEGQFFGCTDKAVATGATIDFRDKGCTLSVIQPERPRFFAGVTVENPDNETLTYDWRLFVKNQSGEQVLNSALGSSSPAFEPYSVGNTIPVTHPCRVTVRVNAPDASRSKETEVWSGQCTYFSTRLN